MTQTNAYLMKIKLFLIFLFLFSSYTFSQDRFLTVRSKDSVGDIPKFQSSLGVNMKLNGYYDMLGGLQDSETFNVGNIKVFGTDDTDAFHMDLYQTQIKMETFYVNDGGNKINAVVEFDFWGGDGKLRLRKAFVEFKHWQIGQNWNNFGDEELWPDIMEWEGPPSGTWLRTPHIKYFNTFKDKSWVYEMSLEAPITNYDSFGDLEPLVEEANQITPDLTFAIKKNYDWGHIRLSSVLRNVRYKYAGEIGNFIGYGASFSGIYKKSRGIFQYQLIAGKGITAYMASVAGLGFDGCPNTNFDISATPATGGWMSYEYYFTKKLHGNVVIGTSIYAFENMERFIVLEGEEDSLTVLDGDFDNFHYYGLFNIMYDPFDRMTIGVELDYGAKKIEMNGYVDNQFINQSKARDAMRISFGFMFFF